MKKIQHKIKLSHVPKLAYIYSKEAIGGLSFPIEITLLLSSEELKKLNRALVKRANENCAVCMALYDFTHSKVCSKHHKYKIWNTFNDISDINYKYLGSNES